MKTSSKTTSIQVDLVMELSGEGGICFYREGWCTVVTVISYFLPSSFFFIMTVFIGFGDNIFSNTLICLHFYTYIHLTEKC